MGHHKVRLMAHGPEVAKAEQAEKDEGGGIAKMERNMRAPAHVYIYIVAKAFMLVVDCCARREGGSVHKW